MNVFMLEYLSQKNSMMTAGTTMRRVRCGLTELVVFSHLISVSMDRFMSIQVGSWSELFITELANMCLLPTMEGFMHLQVDSWSEWFTTELANMCLLPTMEEFMHLRVGGWSD